MTCEPLLLELMPVGIFHRAPARAHARESAARLIRALLPRGRILIAQDPFSLEIEEFLIPFIAQEQRLAAVADENECVMGDVELCH